MSGCNKPSTALGQLKLGLICCLVSPFLCVERLSADELSAEQLLDLPLEQLLSIRVQVGSRAADRWVASFADNVTIITADQLRRSGYDSLPKALNVMLPAFTYAFSTIDDLTPAARPFTFDGLRSDQVLVLINGKRLHRSAVMDTSDTQNLGSASVDLSLIPIETIKRVEILNEDASAQYGSDAIAGVINVILKDAAARNELVLLGGRRRAGDGGLASLTYNFGNQTHFGALQIQELEMSNTSGLDRRDYYFPGDPRNGNDRVNQVYGQPKDRSLMLTLNNASAAEGFEGFYYRGKLVYKTTETPGFFRLPKDDRNIRAFYPDGFLPVLATTQYDLFTSLGLKGTLGEVRYDLSNTLSYNHFDVNVEDSLNASLGLASPTSFDSGDLTYWQNTLNADFQSRVELGLAEPLRIAYGGEFRYESYSIGVGETASWINGGANILDGPNAGTPAAAGAQLFPGFTPDDANQVDRKVGAVYVEGAQRLFEDLDVKLSLRDDYYSDFGNTLNGKAQLSYKPFDTMTWRGSVATGFKAPDLSQAGYSTKRLGFNSATGVWNSIRFLPVDDPLARLLGAESLKPETSQRLGLGLTYMPSQNLRLGIDGFYIRIQDRIAMSGRIENSAQLPADAQAYMRANNMTAVSYFMNAADTSTKGVALSAKYETHLGRGQASLGLDAQHQETSVDAIHIPDRVAFMGDEIFNRIEQERLKHYLPEDKAVLSVEYRRGPLTLNTRATYFGKVLYVGDSQDPASDQWFGGRTTVDLDIDYQFTRHVSLGIGAHNLFDTYPDYRNQDSGLNGKGYSLQYRGISPLDYTGAFYYARVVIAF